MENTPQDVISVTNNVFEESSSVKNLPSPKKHTSPPSATNNVESDKLENTKSYKVIQSHTESNKVIQSHTKSYKVIQSHTESYRIIQSHTESYRVIQSHTESYKVIQRHTKSYKVIQSHTKSYKVIHCHVKQVVPKELSDVRKVHGDVQEFDKTQCTNSQFKKFCSKAP